MKKLYLLLIGLAISLSAFSQKYGNIAPTPPMGWNSWNYFGCNVSEKMIKGIADAMVSTGMKDAGYQYIIIDDCWQIGRDSLGNILADPGRFPSGMKSLSDYVHSKGLKFGIYSDAGTMTCGGRPGSLGFENQDALKYAEWGVDYLKYDWCNTGTQNSEASYKTMRDALYKAGRPVLFSICEWGTSKPWTWAKDVGHIWRTTGDIFDCWGCKLTYGYTWGVYGWTQILDINADLREYAGPDHWNDPDMLEVGNGGMSVNECRAHFSLWCMMAAPLIAGNDLRNMSKETIEILCNKEVIAVDQDTLGIQGYKMVDWGDLELWVKPLSKKEIALCFFNRSEMPQKIDFDWKKYPINDLFAKVSVKVDENYKLRDLWAKRELGPVKGNFNSIVPAHDVIMLKLYR